MTLEEHEPPRTGLEGADHRAIRGDGARFARARNALTRVDTQPALLDAVRKLRRRLPGDERFDDPLSTAGERPIEMLARGVTTLSPERESVAQEIGMAGLQVWQSLSEATGRGRGDQPLALMFTDLVGFSSWALQAGDTTALELVREAGRAVEAAVHSHQGRIVKPLGEGLMATFLDAESAVEAALSAQEALAGVEVDGYRPRMRAGVHVGRPRLLGGDYLGVDVNVAARVGDAAETGEVVVSDSAAHQLDPGLFEVGRPKRLRAEGSPRELQVSRVTRAR
ncbi:MAG: adenylate/guanylate cyclase domain-containing protein [Solirubrobacteraceae bacterium]